MTGIVSWGSYVPRFRIKVEEIAKVWGADPTFYKAGLKVNQKAVPDIDEDTATIAVTAARNCMSSLDIDPRQIGAIYIGSESHPYAVKPTGTIVAEAIGMGPDYTTADFEFACKAGTAAMQVSLGLIKSGYTSYALAGGADTAQSRPGDALEYTAAAGGALFLIGNDNVVATINHTLSFTTDTPDFWRRAHEQYPAHGGAFTGEPAYFKHIMQATKRLLKKANTTPSDYDHVIFHQPNAKFPLRAAKRLGFTDTQLETGLLVPTIGNTYSGAALLGLAAVLDKAKPGERILLTSYGSGAGSDSFDLTVTDNIKKRQKEVVPVDHYLENTQQVNYATYLRFTKRLNP